MSGRVPLLPPTTTGHKKRWHSSISPAQSLAGRARRRRLGYRLPRTAPAAGPIPARGSATAKVDQRVECYRVATGMLNLALNYRRVLHLQAKSFDVGDDVVNAEQ